MTKIPCCCDHDGDQLSLLHFPTPPKTAAPTTGGRWTKYHPKTHQLCDDCTATIHHLGMTAAPPPRPVRWRHSNTEGTALLCEQHKNQRQEHQP